MIKAGKMHGGLQVHAKDVENRIKNHHGERGSSWRDMGLENYSTKIMYNLHILKGSINE